MTKQHELLQDIVEHRSKVQIKDEKKHYKELRKVYGSGRTAILASLLLFFTKYSEDGKLHQKSLSKKRLNGLNKELSEQLSTIYREERKLANTGIKRAIKDEYVYSLFMLSPLLKGKMKNKRLTEKEINRLLEENWSGELYGETLSRRKKEMSKALTRDLLRLTAAGIGIKELNKQFNKRIESALKHSLLVYQNEQTRKRNGGSGLAFDNEGLRPNKVMAVVTNDDRLCDECAPHSGIIFKKEDAPSYPLHPRCRCRLIEIVDGWKQTTQRARDMKTYKGYVTNAKNYEEWKIEQRF